MRKFLLSSTSIVAAATIASGAATIASNAAADVSVTGGFDFKYKNVSSNVTASDGTSMAQDHEVVISFSNKTDSGLTVGGRFDMDGDTAGLDESSISISGGFGSIVLGANDGVSDAFGVTEQDLINDEPHLSKFGAFAIGDASTTSTVGIATNAGEVNASGDDNKIAYFTPAIGGFKAGYSMSDAGAGANSDNVTDMGFSYSFPLEGGSVLAEYNQVTKDGDTNDAEFKAKNYGVTVTMGAMSFIASTMSAEEATAGSNILTEDIEANGIAVKYDLGGGFTIAASSMESEDSVDKTAAGAKEKYSANIGEVSYSIAPGLTANITYNDYDYKAGGSGEAADGGSITQLTINASF